MADRIITAEALITAKDATGDVFAQIGRKLEGVGKSARSSTEVAKLTERLEAAQKQYRALDKLQQSMSGLAKTRGLFNEQKSALEQQAKALRAAEAPTKALDARYRALQETVSRSAAAFDKQRTAFVEAKRAAEQFGLPIGKIASEQERLRGVISGTTRAIEQQAVAEQHAAVAHARAEKAAEKRAHAIAHHGIVNTALGAAAGYAGAHGVFSGIEHAVHAGVELQHERVALQNAGRTPAEIARMEAASRATSTEVPTASYIENLKVLNETTGAFGSVEHAIEHLSFMQKAASVLHATAGEKITDSPGELGNKLARFFEMRGTAGNGEVFQKEASEMIRAMVFTGGNFNPSQMLNFAQQAKSALQNYSVEFMSKVAPSLITEVGGDRAGTQANAFNSVILGKANDKRQAEAWMHFGLIDPKQMIMKQGTPVAWSGGAVYHTDTALQNPLEYGEKYLLPALAAHGVKVDDRLELTKVLGTLFRNQNSNAFANELWQSQNRQRLRKDAGLINEVEQPNAMFERNLKTDPTVAMAALTASLDNLMASVTTAATGPAAKGMAALASGINAISDAAANHPLASLAVGSGVAASGLAAAGWMSTSLMNGFGLKDSATHLDVAATRLIEAAGAIGESKGLPAGEAAKGLAGEAGAAKTGFFGEGGARGVAGTIGEGVVGALLYAGGTHLITSALDALPHPGYPAGYDPQAIRNGGISGDLQRLFGGMHVSTSTPADPWLNGQRQAIERRSELAAKAFRMDPEAARGGAYARLPPVPGSFGSPSSPIDITGKVEAEIKGQANVSVVVKVDGPGEVTGSYASSSGNIRASTGASVPSARAASNGRVAGPN